jgi:hypothetical protein
MVRGCACSVMRGCGVLNKTLGVKLVAFVLRLCKEDLFPLDVFNTCLAGILINQGCPGGEGVS